MNNIFWWFKTTHHARFVWKRLGIICWANIAKYCLPPRPPGESHACKMVQSECNGPGYRRLEVIWWGQPLYHPHITSYTDNRLPPAYQGASWWHLLNLKQDWRCRMYNDSPRSLSGTTINSGLKVIFNLERKPWVLIVCLINTGTGVKWTEQNRPHSLICLTNYTAQTLAGDHL